MKKKTIFIQTLEGQFDQLLDPNKSVSIRILQNKIPRRLFDIRILEFDEIRDLEIFAPVLADFHAGKE